ncbi:amidohydrolase [Metasolibacillus meyeri]|uniref:Amidohydrolase n=1 Tax=Metasolibacillus meyeri TaxID=1071052 RepID=A0AAW9NWV0_9BACL|nr:amidohydrolase [Metasolibacillus meyeri]MEC1179523.1 amidohydrolase [Metasolibacillus meyeri]
MYWLTNARLETGYEMDDETIIGTKAANFHLLIKDEVIAKIVPATERLTDNLPQKDAKNLLVLPSFVEKHCHLDKTLLGDDWRAITPAKDIFQRFEVEKTVLPTLRTTTQERAETLLTRYSQYGVTHVRTHVDIYPEVGLKNLEQVQKALQTFDKRISNEIVAFPQHGLLRTEAKQLVREALRQGAGLVGGVDPAMVDGDIERSLQQMVELAVEGNAGIDLHLHDADQLGIFTIKRLAELTVEADLQGKVAVSHAFALGDIPSAQAEGMADILAKADMTIITSAPIGRNFPPVGLLHKKGVNVAVGCDNIFDSWSPFGNGDILERAGRLAQLSRWSHERALAETLQFITGGIKPLDDKGQQAWPKIGDLANMVLVEASCSAEAIARTSQRMTTIYKGNIVTD